jgi:hypothetical protein
MTAKYDPLARFLANQHPRPVTLTFGEMDRIVGGLPPSAGTYPSWWGNATGHPHAFAWMSAGYRAQDVRLGIETTFVPLGDSARRERLVAGGQRARTVLDGVDQLTTALGLAGYESVVAAVAKHAVFLHPDTVAQTRGQALFPTIRDMGRRREFGVLDDGRRVLFDDNRSPTDAFLWAAGLKRGRDVQFNHVWTEARKFDTYTALWNLFATPAFLAKTTDTSNHPEVTAALRFRSFDLYGHRPAAEANPLEPVGYRGLTWAPFPDPVPNLEAAIRAHLRTTPRSSTTTACRRFGWLFSDWQPDPTV